MTSRERVWKAINHQEPDQVPVDIGGTGVTGVHVDQYVALGKYLEVDLEPPKVYDQFQMLARVDELLMHWFRSDVAQVENLSHSWDLRNEEWRPWRTALGSSVLMPGGFAPVQDAAGTSRLYNRNGQSVAVMPAGGLYFERNVPTAMSDSITKMDPAQWKKSIPLYPEEELRILEARARHFHENTSYSVHGGFGRGMLGTNGLFAGHPIGDWLVILASERDYARSILQATAERAVENLRLYLQAVGRYIDTIAISGTDYGTQRGELFDPRVFRDLHVPSYRQMNDYVHSHCRAKTFFHSCGSVAGLIECFIDAGVDILNPVQTNARNMEPAGLKRDFGDRIVFWGGGIETQTVLPHGTADQVREQVRERIATLAPGGGFVFSPIHNIQSGVPPQNVEAMVRAVRDYGRYPIEC